MIQYSIGSVREQEPVALLPFHEFRFDDGTVWTEFFRLDNGYLLRFPGLADFEVSPDGMRVTAVQDDRTAGP